MTKQIRRTSTFARKFLPSPNDNQDNPLNKEVKLDSEFPLLAGVKTLLDVLRLFTFIPLLSIWSRFLPPEIDLLVQQHLTYGAFAVVAILPFSTWYFFSRHVNSQDASLSARQVVRKFMWPILSRFVENIVTKVRDPEFAYSLFKTVNSVCASLGTYLPAGAIMATIGFFGYMEFAKVGILLPSLMDVVQVGFNKLWGHELQIAIVAAILCFLVQKFIREFNDSCFHDVFLRDQK